MCGLIGYFSSDGYSDDLNKKLELIKHRGPDSQGIYKDFQDNVSIGLGHVRLSILDLSDVSNQPFTSSCGRFIMVYNGEIYNYIQLKDKLKDYKFRTTSDTEVLLNLYIKYGAAMLNDLEGMFAFLIYDKKTKTLFAARDHLGIKPLYIYHDDKKIIFSSEIKTIWKFKDVEKQIETSTFSEFFMNGFLYEPDTGFKNVIKLPPGNYLNLNSSLKLKFERYWKIRIDEDKKKYSIQEVKELIDRSIKQHLVSDVPVGLFFSGGVDSTVLLNSLKNKIDPVIVKSNDKEVRNSGTTNDFYYAKKITDIWNIKMEKIELNEVIETSEDFINYIDLLSQETEEPISDFTFVASKLISKESRKKGYKVMLSGMGADELFGGYPRYKLVQFEKVYYSLHKFLPKWLLKRKSFAKKVDRFNAYFSDAPFEVRYSNLIGYFSQNEISQLLKSADFSPINQKLELITSHLPENTSNLKKAMYLDMFGFLSHNFLVADKSSMLASIELRVPLASKSLLEKVMTIKTSNLLSLQSTKKVLKSILRGSLGRDIIHRKKAGFNPPLDSRILLLGKRRIIEILEKNNAFEVLNKNFVISDLELHFSGKKNHTFRIFQILYFSFWLKNNC